ncbi:MAG TPA: hypothetical protein DCW29_12070, partial [Janthinobacterium sp.]|nr:hypothetical protein [Janthinobacterium sp.]
MNGQSYADGAAAIAVATHGIETPLVVDCAEILDAESGATVYRYTVVAADDANGPAHTVFLDQDGVELDAGPALRRDFARARALLHTAAAAPLAPVTIDPSSNVLTLNPGQILDETITVTIPKNAGPIKADVYFLADTTASMGGILGAVQAGSANVLAALNGLGVDIVFGVGNYKDFASGDPYGFQHQLNPGNVAPAVAAAINAWSASGGGDSPEAALFALDSLAVAPGGGIGWRAGSKRIIVWFGDVPSHDPICSAVSGAPTVTEASATAKLVNEGIAVLAISTANPGLDGDPTIGATGYVAQCGAPGGAAGQASRITAATGGALAVGINAGNLVNTIIALVKSAVGGLQNVKLVPSASVALFVTAINPAAAYGPLSGDEEHVLSFRVRFTGIAYAATDQVFNGSIDVVADGMVVATKKVQITVPACPAFVYSLKFVCGTQPECDCACAPLRPGSYATEIAIHNYSLKPVELIKRFVPLVLAGAAAGREPLTAGPRAEERLLLPAQSATMDDCCHILERLLGAPPPA